MIKTITLKNNNTTGRYDDISPFIIVEDLTLRFKGLAATSGNYYAVVGCNGKSAQYRIENNQITIEKSFFSVGALYLSVVYCLYGKKLGEWTVEPLGLAQVERTDFSASPTIAALESEIRALKSVLEEIGRSVTGLKEKIENTDIVIRETSEGFCREFESDRYRTKAEKVALMKYLYRHYINDLRDSEKDLCFPDFAAAIGLDISDLSAEEREEITLFTTKEDVL